MGRLRGPALSGPRCSFLVPGSLATRTGGYGYDRRIIEGLGEAGWQVDAIELGEGFPWPDASTRRMAEARLAALDDGSLAVVDGLAFGVLPDELARHAERLCLVALVHHPLALETGLEADSRSRLFESERRALALAAGVLVTSPFTARGLGEFGVEPARIVVVEPGTDAAPLAVGREAQGAPLELLCVATITPRKGHRLLVEALGGLADRSWMLRCAGSLAMDPSCVAELRAFIASKGLQDRVLLLGEQRDRGLDDLYRQADLFVLNSFHEGYGMALAEALARGLPIVSTTAGAIADTVPSAAGLLVPPGDVASLREALLSLLDDPSLLEKLSQGARMARKRLPSWRESSQGFAAALLDFAARAKAVS
ncbi:D-inositol 3-phosphate glycosyltransferase [Burkholderiales bacterium 8X]|nr:D-inositol 3-phosphate glycosyltransferase [Burkholderiales bacterium 8X]